MMDNKKLVNEIIEFLFQCAVLNDNITSEEECKIQRGLAEPGFVEELIGIVMNYVKSSKNINYKEVKALYLKLNDLRFDLEYGMHGK
jgi:hypothetical protein